MRYRRNCTAHRRQLEAHVPRVDARFGGANLQRALGILRASPAGCKVEIYRFSADLNISGMKVVLALTKDSWWLFPRPLTMSPSGCSTDPST